MKKFFDWKKIGEMDKNKWLIAVCVGALLLVIALPVDSGKEEKDAGDDTKTSEMGKQTESGKKADTTTEEDYRSSLENELSEMLESMEGVGKVKVMITLKDSGECVVEKDHSDSSSISEETDKEGESRSQTDLQSEETTVYADNESGMPFVSKEKKPAVEGVLVLAEGGGDTAVKQNISDAVLALFNVEAHKIKVVKMSVQEGTE